MTKLKTHKKTARAKTTGTCRKFLVTLIFDCKNCNDLLEINSIIYIYIYIFDFREDYNNALIHAEKFTRLISEGGIEYPHRQYEFGAIALR